MFGLKLHWWVFIGIGVGVVLGIVLHQTYYQDLAREARIAVLGEEYAEAPEKFRAQETARTPEIQRREEELFRATIAGGAVDGISRLFLTLLRMIVIPLVFASLICGVTGLGDPRRLGRLGGRALGYYLTSSLLAILTGLLIVNTLRPGVGANLTLPIGGDVSIQAPGSVWDVLLRMVPDNIVRAGAEGDLFGIIFFAILFGIFTLMAAQKTRDTIAGFFNAVFEVMMKLTMFIIALAPIGIAALIARLVALSGPGMFWELRWYVIAVAAALLIHMFITLPTAFFLLTRRNPFRLMKAMTTALWTGFSTASSAGTLPLTMQRIEQGAGVSNKVSGFVLPLGATVNMDGTALYECVATIFVAQLYAAVNPQFTLTFAHQIIIVVLALMVSIGAAGIPSAGLVMMIIIFRAVGLPLELVGLLWAVDRVLDMARTSVNIWSDVVGATLIAHFEGEIDDAVFYSDARQQYAVAATPRAGPGA